LGWRLDVTQYHSGHFGEEVGSKIDRCALQQKKLLIQLCCELFAWRETVNSDCCNWTINKYGYSLHLFQCCCFVKKSVRTTGNITKFWWTLSTCHHPIFTCWYFVIQISTMPFLQGDASMQ